MDTKIQLLDCTLRDGAYIVDGEFGVSTIRGIIKRLQDAKVEIIECGWLKDAPHKYGTTFYHEPNDILQYMSAPKDLNATYVVMIDYNRYNLENLPPCDGRTIDAIRVVFPKDKVDEGLALAEPIRKKGYRVFFQAANTLAYSDTEVLSLIEKVNKVKPEAISIVDTFGAMYGEDLTRIMSLFVHNLDHDIKIGLHSHNNLQMSFALAIQFVDALVTKQRSIIVDASLCGMGRGAGNANSELVIGFLNKKYKKDYDVNLIIDTIDTYMTQFLNKYEWGYSIPYYISGTYQSHVNNIAYLIKNHKTKSRDLKNIIESLSETNRQGYDYENLEEVYLDYMTKEIDDAGAKEALKDVLMTKNVVIIAPGSSAFKKIEEVKEYITKHNSITIGVNSILEGYDYDYLFFSNAMRYDYAKESYPEIFNGTKKIITSNIDVKSEESEYIINFNNLIKRGWKHFDNAMFLCLRLMDYIIPAEVAIVGFDGYDSGANYFDKNLEIGVSTAEKEVFNNDLREMMKDFVETTNSHLNLNFITRSRFEVK